MLGNLIIGFTFPRDSKREHPIGEKVIRDLYAKYRFKLEL